MRRNSGSGSISITAFRISEFRAAVAQSITKTVRWPHALLLRGIAVSNTTYFKQEPHTTLIPHPLIIRLRGKILKTKHKARLVNARVSIDKIRAIVPFKARVRFDRLRRDDEGGGIHDERPTSLTYRGAHEISSYRVGLNRGRDSLVVTGNP